MEPQPGPFADESSGIWSLRSLCLTSGKRGQDEAGIQSDVSVFCEENFLW